MENEVDKIIERLAANTENWWRPLYYHVVPKIINDNGYKTGIEIGVAFGGHAEAILKNTKIEDLCCIDPWEFTGAEFEGLKSKEDFDSWCNWVTKRLSVFNERIVINRIKSDDCVDFIQDDKVDFVFIDGEHTYEQVKKDIQNYLPKIKEGGMLIGHDYGHPDFEGVKRAVDEFIESTGRILTVHDGYVWSTLK